MKKIMMILLMAMALGVSAKAQTAGYGIPRPKLVVGVVVDQMRWDYMFYYADRFDGGGFERLLGEGFSCNSATIDYMPTITACGHASIYTGTTPAMHGIAGNNYYLNGKYIVSVEDNTVVGVGTSADSKAGQRSPRNLLSTTIGDELRAATSFRSRVFGVALKDRAAILPAGHSANAAYWYDSRVPGFITSTYYMDKLPKWVEKVNKDDKQLLDKSVVYRAAGVKATFDMARAILTNEKLGQNGETDMLAISVSGTDMAGHTYGTRSPETDSCYLELDRQLAQLFNALDAQVGKGNYLLFLSADHGGTNNALYNGEHKLPTGGWEYWKDNKDYNKVLKEQFGVDKLVKEVNEFNIYVNNDSITKYHLNRNEVVAAIKAYFEKDPDVAQLIDVRTISDCPLPAEMKERIIKGFNPERSGELFLILKPGRFCGSDNGHGSNHGTPSMDDSHIPCVFMGWGIQHGETAHHTGMIDIAPTICSLLHIQMPSAALGNPIPEVVK